MQAFPYAAQLDMIRRELQDDPQVVEFRPASRPDLEYLVSNRYPKSVLAFFESAEPSAYVDIEGARIYSVRQMRVENEGAVPGCVVFTKGYLNIGSTEYGDVYCLDLNTVNSAGEPVVVLVGHDMGEDYEVNVKDWAIHVADSFAHFLTLFAQGALPIDFWDLKDGE